MSINHEHAFVRPDCIHIEGLRCTSATERG